MAQKEGWQGDEAATFVAELCELPQYAATANRNFSLSSLRQLKRQGFLSKGLSRAGICDWQHQKRIDAELGDLEKALPAGMEGRVLARSASAPNAVLGADAVLRKNHVRQPGPPISVQRNARLVCPSNMIMRSPPLTSTAKSMLKASTSVGCLAPDGYRSSERISPNPYMACIELALLRFLVWNTALDFGEPSSTPGMEDDFEPLAPAEEPARSTAVLLPAGPMPSPRPDALRVKRRWQRPTSRTAASVGGGDPGPFHLGPPLPGTFVYTDREDEDPPLAAAPPEDDEMGAFLNADVVVVVVVVAVAV
ncbi:hypothetical protein AK812_SmicGene44780, partial [Symbiodinium microadriaticum]